jgi:hypothetical protein
MVIQERNRKNDPGNSEDMLQCETEVSLGDKFAVSK